MPRTKQNNPKNLKGESAVFFWVDDLEPLSFYPQNKWITSCCWLEVSFALKWFIFFICVVNDIAEIWWRYYCFVGWRHVVLQRKWKQIQVFLCTFSPCGATSWFVASVFQQTRIALRLWAREVFVRDQLKFSQCRRQVHVFWGWVCNTCRCLYCRNEWSRKSVKQNCRKKTFFQEPAMRARLDFHSCPWLFLVNA